MMRDMVVKVSHLPHSIAWRGLKWLGYHAKTEKEIYRWSDFLQESQWWSAQLLQEYQERRLLALLTHAYKNVPYYTRIFDERGLHPNDFRSIPDLRKLPILTKELVEKNYTQLISRVVQEKGVLESHTSGSTGKPLKFLIDRYSSARENAFKWRAWSFGRYQPGELVIMMRTYVPKSNQPLSFLDKANNFLYLSAYHLTDRVMREYVDIINKSGGRILRGYPSAIYLFARFLNEHGIVLSNIDTIITSSETLLPQYRQEIETAFKTKVLDWYGCNERVITLEQCTVNHGYHTNSEYGVMEIVDQNGEPINAGVGFVLGTSLHNFVMPLIRYKTGDLAEKTVSHKCACGRGLPIEVMRLEGRSDEILFFNEKSIPSINFYTLFHGTHNIVQFQLVQDSFSELHVNLVVTENFSSADRERVANGLSERIGNDIKLEICLVDAIERDERTGKVRCVINKMSANKT